VNRRRPTWSAPTLVVEGDIVLSADRGADASAPGAPKEGDGSVWVVNSLGGNAPQGAIVAFSAGSGKRLWEAPCRECYNAPVDVLVSDGLVWSGDLVRSRDPGVTRALDLLTGELRRERPRDQTFFKIRMSHHRCYRNRATSKWLILGRDGIEFIDTATGKGFGHAWVRGSCQYGVMPANGLIYAPPHSCACHIESKLNGFNALSPAAEADASARPGLGDDAPRTEHGPAFGTVPTADAAVAPGDWPTHRHDGLRSGRASSVVPPALVPAWEARVGEGRISAPVVAAGVVLVSCVDAHEVCALDADGGKERWRFTAGGRVDSPPTYVGGAAIFGSADGWVYCLRASDGALAWRFRAAPEERRIVSYDRLESAWPVHGSVLVRDGVVYAVAGRSGHLDGGMRLCRIEAATGRLLSETRVEGGALPDVLSCDGESVFMQHLRFDLEGARADGPVPHLYSSAGLLDGDWWHRTYWFVGTRMGSGWGAWPNSGRGAAAGRLLILDDDTVYGFGRLNQYHRNGTHVGLGRVRCALYSCRLPSRSEDGRRGTGRAKGRVPPAEKAVYGWKKALPFFARAMVLSGGTLFAAGPPDVLTASPEGASHAYHRASTAGQLEEQAEAFAGRSGGILRAVAARDGATLAELRLESPPAFDGMAVARGRLYVSTVGGRIITFQGAVKE
jgi:outer membrane protein assembly factor BamB